MLFALVQVQQVHHPLRVWVIVSFVNMIYLDIQPLIIGNRYQLVDTYWKWRSQGFPGWAAHPEGQIEEENEKLRKNGRK